MWSELAWNGCSMLHMLLSSAEEAFHKTLEKFQRFLFSFPRIIIRMVVISDAFIESVSI